MLCKVQISKGRAGSSSSHSHRIANIASEIHNNMARNMKSSITALAGLWMAASVMAIDSSLTSIIPKRTLDEDKNITLRTGIILAPPFAMET